ncbi:hypothetical protein JTB14_032091 [Gonioctena quinquepunctata]|nr:hypothetical protein JTB14_032091 [Gonioctena quinquepunctata]
MSSNNANTRSRSTQGFLGLLSRVSKSELKQIRVAVKRNNITATGPPGPIQRSIDDPKLIVPLVHCKKDLLFGLMWKPILTIESAAK